MCVCKLYKMCTIIHTHTHTGYYIARRDQQVPDRRVCLPAAPCCSPSPTRPLYSPLAPPPPSRKFSLTIERSKSAVSSRTFSYDRRTFSSLWPTPPDRIKTVSVRWFGDMGSSIVVLRAPPRLLSFGARSSCAGGSSSGEKNFFSRPRSI